MRIYLSYRDRDKTKVLSFVVLKKSPLAAFAGV